MSEKSGSRRVCRGWNLVPVLLLVLLLSRLSSRPAQAMPLQQERRIDYQGPIGYGERVIGPLQPDVVAQVWEFRGSQGDEVAMAMNALTEELDPYLLLLIMDDAQLEEFIALSDDELADLEAATAERGLLLALDDDGGEDTNALIPSFVLPADGRYFVVASSCCTGDSTGRYELILDFLGNQGPGAPEQPPPRLRGFAPPEGQPGSELVMTLDGENLPALGEPLRLVIGGVEMTVLDFEVVDDQTLQLATMLPEETPPGEQEISFFFENGVFDGAFLVLGAEPGASGSDGSGPTEVPPVVDPGPNIEPPGFPWPVIVIGAILLLGIAGGAVAWGLLRSPTPSAQPAERPPEPPPAPDVRFELERDAGRQSLEAPGGRLRADVDIRFRLRLEGSTQEVDDGGSSLTG